MLALLVHQVAHIGVVLAVEQVRQEQQEPLVVLEWEVPVRLLQLLAPQ
jgi:hypothetical protein